MALAWKNLTCCPYWTDVACSLFCCCFFYNVINEYLDSERYSSRGRGDCVPKKNYAIGQTFPN